MEQRKLTKERTEPRPLTVKKTPAPPAPKPPAPAAGQKAGGIKFNERAEVREVEKNKESR